jgi:ParB-like chromosome segregation protein Spo0J
MTSPNTPELRPALDAKRRATLASASKTFTRHLRGKDWLPSAELGKKIGATEADSYLRLKEPGAAKNMKSQQVALRGRQLLVDDFLEQARIEGSCETRKTDHGMEVRLITTTGQPEVANADGDSATTAVEALHAEGKPTQDQNGNMAGLTYHPVADTFPLLKGKKFDELKEDIRVQGLREPIWTYQGRIIDGRNRYRVCQELGITAPTQEWAGPGTVVEFVISKNLRRRDLSASQRAMIAAALKPLFEEEARERMLAGKAADPGTNLSQGRVREQLADLVHVSSGSIQAAAKVQEQGTAELIQAVSDDLVSVSAAADLAELPADEQVAAVASGPKEVQARAKDVRKRKAGKKRKAGAATTKKRGMSPGAPAEEQAWVIPMDPNELACVLRRLMSEAAAIELLRNALDVLTTAAVPQGEPAADVPATAPDDPPPCHRGDQISITKLNRTYGPHATAVLKEYLREIHKRKRGTVRKYKVLKPLPSKNEFSQLRDRHFTSTIADLVDAAFATFAELSDELQEWSGNLPEQFQDSEKASRLEESSAALANLSAPLVADELGRIPIVHVPPERDFSRAGRLDCAVVMLEAVIARLSVPAGGETAESREGERKAVIAELENIVDEAQDIEFPSMFG